MNKTEVGILLGDPSDKVYVHPPLEEWEHARLIEGGVINAQQKHIVTGANTPISLIDIGPEMASLEHSRRERTYRTALGVVEVLSSFREEVALNENAQRTVDNLRGQF